MERWLEPLALFGVGAACVLWERWREGTTHVKTREYLTDIKGLMMAIGSSAVVAAVWAALWSPASHEFRSGRVFGSIVVFDGLLYGLHRFCHSPRGWPMHRPHHAPKHFEASMAFRDSWAHLFVYAVMLRSLGTVLRLSALELATLSTVFIVFQWWTHLRVPVSLGVLDYVFIGPGHHALHHVHERRLWAKNLGGLFCLWDQLFGTYLHPADAEAVA